MGRSWLFVPAIALLLGSCASGDGDKKAAIPPPVVTASVPLQKKIQDFEEFTGRVAPFAEVDLRSRVSGYLKQIHFADGDFVKEGQLLFEIDPSTFEADVNQRKASLERANASLALATANEQRGKTLVDQGVIAAQEYEVLVAERLTAAADVTASQAALDAANLELSFTKISSPINGRISAATVSVGNLVSAGSAGGGTTLASIISQEPMYAYFDLDENKVVEIRTGRVIDSDRTVASREIPVLAAMGDTNKFDISGMVDYTDWGVKSETGTIRARATFDNKDRMLVAGMFVRIRVLGEADRNVILLPQRAIGTDQDRKFVYVIDAQGLAQYQGVKLGRELEGMVEIKEGLDGSETVIIDGVLKVRPGVKPEVKETKLDAAPATPALPGQAEPGVSGS